MKRVLTVLGVVTILSACFYLYSTRSAVTTPTAVRDQRLTLTGLYRCLPAKDDSDPETANCVLGMRADSGLYYVLDFSLVPQTRPLVNIGARISAAGVYTPVERSKNAALWKKYQVAGIFSVTDSFREIPS